MKTVKIERNIIEYQDLGKGQPIIFIHGAFSNGNTWRKVIPQLSNNYRCIIPEWPFGGHKVPILNELDFSPDGIAELIAKLITKLGLHNSIIIANDTGGAYAQVFASKYNEMISHLILSNCEGFEIFPPKKFKSLSTMVKIPGYMWLMAKLFSYKASLKWDMTFGLLSHKLTKEDISELYVKNFVKNNLIREDFRKMAVQWDPLYTERAAIKLVEFNKPVLITWGKDDFKLFPMELGKKLKTIFPNVKFVEIENSKTYVQEDNPIALVESINQFLK
ncbi:alpha/beta fold hydrolase [Aureispira anguillae]|uniref:Alpha/beta hydrolase n=1 Tax=Aureispira anguillae TaxID=2864201 RepID=A0A916DRW2_9BACT|nr:alpha/beta hydrolase [Aureispira anguillae]BDS11511.1 alpha/beta hydrolase [Aureispira anguillae]